MTRPHIHSVVSCVQRRDGDFLITYREPTRKAIATALSTARLEIGDGFAVKDGRAYATKRAAA